LGIPVEDQLTKINSCLADIDQLLIPSTINNYLNQRFVFRKEREIIAVFQECDARALNYLISHVKLGLLFYKIKDHRNFTGQHRTELIQLLAVDRLPVLTVMSRVIVLHALQLMKLRANPRAEYWVRNVILNTHQNDLSELKTLTDAKGDYFSMNKLIYDDIKSETIRQDILNHIRREATVQRAHLKMGTRKGKRQRLYAWRKILSDVDDTLCSSGGSYPAGIDKRYGKKVVYPGVLAFYRELDLGTQGPEEWPENRVGNLVFLSARPHVYKDMSEKINFAKFEKLRLVGNDGRKGLHTTPSLLAGDIASGRKYIATNDMEPLALKKFDNFKRYVSIYPEFNHIFICDNGQGDVRAGELMFDFFPYEVEGLYVHLVQDRTKTFGYEPERWRSKGLSPCFFRTYPEAALDAVTRDPPLIRDSGLKRVCLDAVKDFMQIQPKQWLSPLQKSQRRAEVNQGIWLANQYLKKKGMEPVELIQAERVWAHGQLVKTPFGIGRVVTHDPEFDMYEVELDWRPLNVQVAEYPTVEAKDAKSVEKRGPSELSPLETVMEVDEENGGSSSRQVSSDDLVETEHHANHSRSHSTQVEALAAKGVADVDDKMKRSDSTPDLVPEDTGPTETLSEQLDAASSPVKKIEQEMQQNGVTKEVKKAIKDSDAIKETATEESFPAVPDDQLRFRVYARIRGVDITKFAPPTLPKLEKIKGGSLFTFWTAADNEKKPTYKEGDQCTTPYGAGFVEKYREKDGVVVVGLSGWKARAYLQEKDVHVVSRGLLHTLRRQFTATDNPSTPKAPEFPYAEGTVIHTPYGDGIVTKPLAKPKTDSRMVKADEKAKIGDKLKGEKAPATAKEKQPEMIGISLTDWTLADQSHPMLYCPVETARDWKDNKKSSVINKGGGVLSALAGSLIAPISFLSRGGTHHEAKISTKESPTPKFEQYYKDGAAVTTSFGNGVVKSFRPSDGFYNVSLVDWTLANDKHATAILRKDDISYRIAKGCHEGYPVLTSIGVSGTLASVEPTTGVHIVTVPSAGLVCYLQPDDIVCPLKAARGDDVLTAYGDGKVVRYRQSDDTYEIQLNGWNATLFAKAEAFDRDLDSIHDSATGFGMKWLLGFLFSTSGGKAESQRSRSNSIASVASNWSQKTPAGGR
jgi:hypothetical protein